MVWIGSTIFSTNKKSIILSKSLDKSLLLVIVFEDNCLQKVVRSNPEPRGNFEQIQICINNLLH